MSYSFGMFFLPIGTFGNALKKAQKFTEILSDEENIKKMLENQRYYFPSQRYFSVGHTRGEEVILCEADRRAINEFCTLNFVYFHEAKLLGLVGYSYPEADRYFKKHITFQNSCDQDYEHDVWKGIKCFEQIWDECSKASAEDIFKYKNSKYDDMYSAEKIEENLEYYQRSLAYDRVFELLHLSDWLYDKDNKAFTRFSMSAITTFEKQYNAEKYVQSITRDIYNSK